MCRCATLGCSSAGSWQPTPWPAEAAEHSASAQASGSTRAGMHLHAGPAIIYHITLSARYGFLLTVHRKFKTTIPAQRLLLLESMFACLVLAMACSSPFRSSPRPVLVGVRAGMWLLGCPEGCSYRSAFEEVPTANTFQLVSGTLFSSSPRAAVGVMQPDARVWVGFFVMASNKIQQTSKSCCKMTRQLTLYSQTK